MSEQTDKMDTLKALSLEDKILLSKIRIQQWYEHYNGSVYVAFSGGKDSTVLLHLVRSIYPEVVGVFNNTGLEFPEIKEFVKNTENVTWLTPKTSYQETVKKHGFAVVSKDISQKVNEYRHTKSDKLRNIRKNGYPSGMGKISNKWFYLTEAPFEISQKCCDNLKKNPAKIFEKKTGLKPFIGTMLGDSNLRKYQYSKDGCNAYESKRPTSKPISAWTEENIYEYINKYNIPYANKIYDKGYKSTGCAWCAFGVHLEDPHNNRFHKLKKSHPKIWNYAINKMGLRQPFDYIGINFGEEEKLLIQDDLFGYDDE